MTRAWGAPWLLLTLAVLFWSGNFVIGRFIAPVAPPLALAFWRWTLALIPILWLGHGPLRRDWPVLRAQWKIVVLLGVLGIAMFNSLVYLGLQSTSSINGLLLQSAMPLLILLVAFALFGERPQARQILGVVIAVLGVLLIGARGRPGDLLALRLNPGDALVMLAVVAYAFYSALLRKRPALHPLSFLAATFAVGALAILPFALAEHLSGRVMPVTGLTLSVMAYLVLFPSFLSYLFFNRGVALIGAGRAAPVLYLMPVFGSVMAMVFLGERLETYHLAGAGLIALGLMAGSLGLKRKA